jgi:hypothetical protein
MALRRQESKGAIIVLIMLIFLAAFGAVFTGIAISYYVLSPPVHYVGTCAPPAQITANGCFITQTGSNGQPIKIPAGTVNTNSGYRAP